MKWTTVLFYLLGSVTAVHSQLQPPTPVTVAAPAGTIIGQTGRINSSVHEFLGIPFADAPRFLPPIRKPSSAVPITARKFGLSCPSLYRLEGTLPVNLTAPEGEDCLSLNIWRRPALSNAPVLVWIYGGGFLFGTSNSALYDGTYFSANNDVVIVSINYRTNVFGFPNGPTIGTENVGLIDQRVAVEWVRDNIASFGGNPNKITIFGHSAGGASVDIWSYAYPKDPIVKGFIEMSGSATLVPLIGGGITYYAWGNLTKEVGCSGTESEQLACMKNVDWKKIKDGVGAIYGGGDDECSGSGGGLSRVSAGFFGPRVDGKLVFSVEEYERKGTSGEFAKLPVLLGTTNQEIPPSNVTEPPNPECPPTPPPIGGIEITPKVAADIATAVAFTCPSRKQARFRSANNVPIWRYRYFGSFNFTTDDLDLGATHGSELPVVFGLSAVLRRLPAREMGVLREIQAAWSAFATSPSTALSVSPFRWPRYTSILVARNLIRLAYEDDLKASFGTNLLYDYWCDILPDDGSIPGRLKTRMDRRTRALEPVRPDGVTEEDVERAKRLTPEQLETLRQWAVRRAGI